MLLTLQQIRLGNTQFWRLQLRIAIGKTSLIWQLILAVLFFSPGYLRYCEAETVAALVVR